jgi:hypothetical protein
MAVTRQANNQAMKKECNQAINQARRTWVQADN